MAITPDHPNLDPRLFAVEAILSCAAWLGSSNRKGNAADSRLRRRSRIALSKRSYFFFSSTTLPSSCLQVISFSLIFEIVTFLDCSSPSFFMVTVTVSFSTL